MNTIQNYEANQNTVNFTSASKLNKAKKSINIKGVVKYATIPVATFFAYLGINKNSDDKKLKEKQNALYGLYTTLYNQEDKSDLLQEFLDKKYHEVYADLKALIEPKVDKVLTKIPQKELPNDCKNRVLEALMNDVQNRNEELIDDNVIYSKIFRLKKIDKENAERKQYILEQEAAEKAEKQEENLMMEKLQLPPELKKALDAISKFELDCICPTYPNDKNVQDGVISIID